MPTQFQVGETYTDRRGPFTVLSVSQRWLIVEYEDGTRTPPRDVKILTRIVENVAREKELAKPKPQQCAAYTAEDRRRIAKARRHAADKLAQIKTPVLLYPLDNWLAVHPAPVRMSADAEATLDRADLDERYVRLAVKITADSYKGKLRRPDQAQDAFQTALLALVEAAAEYEPGRVYGKAKIRFSTYAGRQIGWRLAKYRAAEAKVPFPAEPGQSVHHDRRGDPRKTRTLDDLAAEAAADRAEAAADRAEAAAREAREAARFALAVARLTPNQRQVTWLWGKAAPGRHAAEAAAALGHLRCRVFDICLECDGE